MDCITKCYLLQSIDLFHCNITDTGLQYIFDRCIVLKKIRVWYCYNVTDIGFKSISNSIESIILFCSNITDITLEYIFTKCFKLKYFRIISSNNLTCAGFKHISKDNCIECIDISRFKKRYINISHIFSKCTNLKEISIYYCKNIVLKNICNCAMLKSVNINYCNIMDKDLNNISKCPALENFSISGCDDITLLGLNFIIDNCKMLKYIYTNNYISTVKQKCKYLNITYECLPATLVACGAALC